MSLESAFGKEVMLRHGARHDLKLFRNNVGLYWAGHFVERTKSGLVVLSAAAQVRGGLPEGSADYIGIQQGTGKFVSLELKREGGSTDADRKKRQLAWQKTVLAMGGIAGHAETMLEVDLLLGPPA